MDMSMELEMGRSWRGRNVDKLYLMSTNLDEGRFQDNCKADFLHFVRGAIMITAYTDFIAMESLTEPCEKVGLAEAKISKKKDRVFRIDEGVPVTDDTLFYMIEKKVDVVLSSGYRKRKLSAHESESLAEL